VSVNEAKLERQDGGGRRASGDGWFVLGAADAAWITHPKFGSECLFEGNVRWDHLGINICVLEPGQPNGYYHRELEDPEDFLVLAGECLLLIEEQERRLKAWDFVHCPPGTAHIFVGAGEGPCAILMIGARVGRAIVYPRSELALRHEAGVEIETDSPREAYSAWPDPAPGGLDRWQALGLD
jgi:uncharacterized cupin superfamily protein